MVNIISNRFLTTNPPDGDEKVYHVYKCRGQVEQVFDTSKNFLDADKTFIQNEKALDGWSFINFLAVQAYYKIYQWMKQIKLLKKFSEEDIVHIAMKKRKPRIGTNWTDSDVTQKHIDLIAGIMPQAK